MKESFQIEGYWWLTEIPESRIAGIFHFNPNHLSNLKIFGDLEHKENFVIAHFLKSSPLPSVILGEDENGNMISLFVEGYGQKHFNFSSSFPLISYQIRYCIKGIHLSKIDECVFNKIKINLGYLFDWMNYYVVGAKIQFESSQPVGFSFCYKSPESKELIDLCGGFKLELENHAGFSDFKQEEIVISQKHYVSLHSTNKIDFLSLLEKAYRFKSFLDMAVFQDNDFLSVKLYNDNLATGSEDDKSSPVAYELFLSQMGNHINSIKGRDFLFKYDAVKDVFPSLIRKWFKFESNMMPIIHHFTDSIKDTPIFKPMSFLNVIQAIEGYHHRFFEQKMSKRYSLKDRLDELIYFFASDVGTITSIDSELSADTRHYYSHYYLKSTSRPIAEGAALHDLTSKLRYLLICCLLYEVGMDEKRIAKILLDTNL